jgi:curved DNA-binding protein
MPVTDAAKQDLYGVLGVSRDADEEKIRKAYRQLARRYHPDVNPGDKEAEESFKAISEAYAVLSDPERRRNYDEFGEISLEGGFDAERARQARESFGRRFGAGGPGGGFFARGGESFHFDDLEGLFSDLFARSGRGGGPRGRRGADQEAEIELDFVDAVRGGEHRLSFARPTADGGRIRLRGKGSEGLGSGEPGDLYARIRIRPHAFFRREGRDLYLDLPVSMREATLGAKVQVPTLEGRVTLTIPAGTDSGSKLRLRGKGVPSDLYVVVQIRVPRDLPPEAAEKLEALAEYEPADLRKELS